MKIEVFENDLPDSFDHKGDLAIDTESMGLNLNRDRLCLLQFSLGDDKAYIVRFTDRDYVAPNLKKLLSDPSREKILHYARFDVAMVAKYLGVWMEPVFCTKIASKLVRTYSDFHGLKELCRELLSVQISKQQQSSYWGDSKISREQLEYAAKDVIYLHRIRDVLSDMLAKEGRSDLARELFSFLKTRVKLDLAGWSEVDIFAHK